MQQREDLPPFLLASSLGAVFAALPPSALRQFDSLACLGELKTLYLSRKQLTAIPPLEQLVNLETVWLNSNMISEVGDAFRKNHWIKSICLNNNQLSELGSYAGCPILQKLHMAYNRISEIPCTLMLPSTLKSLILSQNLIQTLEPLTYVHMPQLQMLYVAGNLLTSGLVLRRLCSPKLKNVYLDNNKIVDFQHYEQICIVEGGSISLVNLDDSYGDQNALIFKVAKIRSSRAKYKAHQRLIR